MKLRTKSNKDVEQNMYVYDVNGAYEILEIDAARHCCVVREIYFDEDGNPYPVGQSWMKTFSEIRNCD